MKIWFNILFLILHLQYWDTMIYAFIQSSNYSNVYNILQPEALDLESYRNFVEQNHVNANYLRLFFYCGGANTQK